MARSRIIWSFLVSPDLAGVFRPIFGQIWSILEGVWGQKLQGKQQTHAGSAKGV